MLGTLLLGVLAGANRYAHVNALCDDSVNPDLLGVEAGNRSHAKYGLPGPKRLTSVRGDRGYGTERVMAALEQRGQAYLFKLVMRKKVKELVAALAGEDGWKAAGPGCQAVEVELQLAGWPQNRHVTLLLTIAYSAAAVLRASFVALVRFLRDLQNAPQLTRVERWYQILARALLTYFRGGRNATGAPAGLIQACPLLVQAPPYRSQSGCERYPTAEFRLNPSRRYLPLRWHTARGRQESPSQGGLDRIRDMTSSRTRCPSSLESQTA